MSANADSRQPWPAVRMASCGVCCNERPSSPSLPFFEARGPGTQDDRCAECRYFRVAHDLKAGGRPLPGVCDAFVPMLQGYATDSFYCGCGGWD